MKSKKIGTSFFFIFVLIFVTYAAESVDVDLVWNPGKDLDQVREIDMTFWRLHPIWLSNVQDSRSMKVDQRNVIGLSYEEDEKVPGFFTTDDQVTKWLTDVSKYLFGFYVGESSGKMPEFIINFSLKKFWVTEDATYNGKISVFVTITDRQKNVRYQGIVNGESRFWGSTFDEDTYVECIGNACIDLIHNFLKDRSIQDALYTNVPVSLNPNQIDNNLVVKSSVSDNGAGSGEPDNIIIDPLPMDPSIDGGFNPDIDRLRLITDKPSEPVGFTITSGALMLAGIVLLSSFSENEDFSEDEQLLIPAMFFTASGICGGFATAKWVKYGNWAVKYKNQYSNRQLNVNYSLNF
jgi:hypothetical protein